MATPPASELPVEVPLDGAIDAPIDAPAEPAGLEDDAELVEVAARLRISITRLARVLRQQDQHGLPPTLAAALATIAWAGPLTLGELAAHEQVAPPTITKVIAKLEDRGLVERKTDDADRRVSWVEASPAGRRQLEEARTRRTAWLYRRLRELPAEDQARLGAAADVLEHLTAAPERDRPST
jgi:DNA-binding MarR family transcriptional regulator